MWYVWVASEFYPRRHIESTAIAVSYNLWLVLVNIVYRTKSSGLESIGNWLNYGQYDRVVRKSVHMHSITRSLHFDRHRQFEWIQHQANGKNQSNFDIVDRKTAPTDMNIAFRSRNWGEKKIQCNSFQRFMIQNLSTHICQSAVTIRPPFFTFVWISIVRSYYTSISVPIYLFVMYKN